MHREQPSTEISAKKISHPSDTSEQQPIPPAWQAAPFKLGENRSPQDFSDPDQACSHVLALVQQARRTIHILSPDLDLWLYQHSSMKDAFSNFLLRSPQNRLRILHTDSRQAVREGHCLIGLSQRLPSRAEIRQCHPRRTLPKEAFLLADDIGLLMRPQSGSFAGYASYYEPAQVRRWKTYFEEHWRYSILDPNLRRLSL